MAEGTLAAVLGVVGRSGSGKTTLIEGAVRILQEADVRVAVVKHTHKALDLDRPGKDSWRFREAGAARTVLAGLHWTVTQEAASGLDALLPGAAAGMDLVIVEGFARDGLRPRVEVVGPGQRPLYGPEEVDGYLVREGARAAYGKALEATPRALVSLAEALCPGLAALPDR